MGGKTSVDRKSGEMYTFNSDKNYSAPECPALNNLEGWVSGAFFVSGGVAI
jgi:hypothetical protein